MGFPQEHSLNRHFIRNHNKREKQQECDLCEYSTKNPGNMAQHSLIHTEEKPYDCKDCRDKFELAEELNGHMALERASFQLQTLEAIFLEERSTEGTLLCSQK